MFDAMRLASSLLSNLAADRRSGSFEIHVSNLLSVGVPHDVVVRLDFG
jgi:hypothetical protein